MTEAEGITEDLNFKLNFKRRDLLIYKSQALKRVINEKALFPHGHQFSEKHAYVFRMLIREKTHNIG